MEPRPTTSPLHPITSFQLQRQMRNNSASEAFCSDFAAEQALNQSRRLIRNIDDLYGDLLDAIAGGHEKHAYDALEQILDAVREEQEGRAA